MTDANDVPTPREPDADAKRADHLIDAVVGDTAAPDTRTAPAEPASADNSTKKKSKKGKPEPTTFGGKLWHGWIKPIGTVFIVVALLRSTIIDWNDVPSGSMEPTILVGDRILVNKMAYALQVPLSGPKIGVPFTAMQWDNPLDGLPSWQWGTPVRGDIVTFWNPVTGVRMVKRIVAQPGDTLELRGGVMTITPKDGTPTTAAYVDTTPSPQPLTDVFDAQGKRSQRLTERFEETLLGETRTIQHIPDNWIDDWAMYRFADGREFIAEDGRVRTNEGQRVPVEAALAQIGETPTLRLAIREGTPFVDDREVSYNAFAEAYLAPHDGQPAASLSNGHTLGVEAGGWQIDNQPASSEQAMAVLNDAGPATLSPEAARLAERMSILRRLMTSSFGPVTLGDDAFYMIGDNRNNSSDSRYFGPVMRSEITGEAVAIPVSFHGRILQLPPKPRWSRWFHGLD